MTFRHDILTTVGADARYVRTINGIGPVAGDVPVERGVYAAERDSYANRLRALNVTSPNYSALDTFADTAGWTPGAAATIDGESTLQWTAGARIYPKKTYAAPLTITADQLNVYVRFHCTNPSDLGKFIVYFYDAAGTNGFGAAISTPAAGWDPSGWQVRSFKRSAMSAYGAADWGTVQQIKLFAEKSTGGAAQPVLAIDEIAVFAMRPVCSIWIDDGHTSAYDSAFPIMAAKGFTGSLTVIGKMDYYGADHMTLQEHRLMAQAGWDLSNHTLSHADLTTLNEADQRTEIGRGLGIALRLGGGASAYHFVPPQARHNALTHAIVPDYASLMRADVGANSLPIADMWSVRSRDTSPTTPVERITGWIDQAIANQEWLIILFHKILDTGVPYSVSVATFQAIVDYLDAQRANIDTMPPSLALARM